METQEKIEYEQTQNTLRAMRPELLAKLKPHYGKRGRPTKQEWLDAGKPLTRAQWEALWHKHQKRSWGGKRPGSGSLPKGRTKVRIDVMIDLGLAEKLAKLPRGEKSKYVNKAIELLTLMEEPKDGQKKPEFPPRGRHAHKPEGWKQTRGYRMTPLELARRNLELAKERLAVQKELEQLEQAKSA
jgi:hypothetical protein